MLFSEKGDVRIHYEEFGSGFPLLVRACPQNWTGGQERNPPLTRPCGQG
jgi:hypothetical protein